MKTPPPVETVPFTKVVRIEDADGRPIRAGSVLRHVDDGERGIVRRVVRFGEYASMFSCVGDVEITTSPGCTRVSNQYAKWRHIPRNEQTYEERFQSWLALPYEHEDSRSVSKAEGLAIDGIMALLPDDVVDWEYGPWPDRIEDALRFLAEHLSERGAQE